jgi:hypothetical protein
MHPSPGSTAGDQPSPTPTRETPAPPPAEDGEEISPCPNCGAPMYGVRGSKQAVCGNCGFKDSCCF